MDMALYTMICQPICENDLKPKNFSAYGHGPIYTIYRGTPAPRQGPCSYLYYDLLANLRE